MQYHAVGVVIESLSLVFVLFADGAVASVVSYNQVEEVTSALATLN
jgi:hypothetical protein